MSERRVLLCMGLLWAIVFSIVFIRAKQIADMKLTDQLKNQPAVAGIKTQAPSHSPKPTLKPHR